jgi:hypothetical protein
MCLPEIPTENNGGTSLKRMRFLVLSIVVAGVFVPAPDVHARDPGKTIFGYVERVVISGKGLSLKARLDTGAETSSLDARNIHRFRRGEARYVRFEVEDRESGERTTLERPLARMVRIRQHDGSFHRRPVVKMWVCMGHIMREVDVNLTSRSEFLYPMLIGRSAMRGSIIVDPDLTFTNRPQCDLSELAE